MIHRPQPAVAEISIIMPVFNDEPWIARAIDSCLSQTLTTIEIVVVDDASTDHTVSIVEHYQYIDDRVRLVKLDRNGSALRARKVGLDAATAEHVMFLDGDDELVPEACATALHTAQNADADVVGFGCQVVAPDGTTGSHYERSMQPAHSELFEHKILDNLFPSGQNAQGQLWRYLFAQTLLKAAYRDIAPSLSLPRMNDLPIAFLALMRARHYVSIEARLYRYYFRRGASGHQVVTWTDYVFNASALNSIDAIGPAVRAEADERSDDGRLLKAYASVRLSVIGRVLNYVYGITRDSLRSEALTALIDRVGALNLAVASSDFCPRSLPMLAAAIPAQPLSEHKPAHVVLRTGNLRTGGVQGVVVAQADHLIRAGIGVTVVLDSEPTSAYALPAGVELLQLEGQTRGDKVSFLAELCEAKSADVVIDHHIFYNDRWPYFALGLSGAGVSTIGWIHNFALRPLLDEVSRLSFLDKYLPILSTVVVLSEPDVVYWKLRGISNVVFLPNPPSPLVQQIPVNSAPRTAPTDRLEIVWWGRMQQRTKQVLDLIDVGVNLRELGVDFRITIVGPAGPDLNARQIERKARDRGISKNVVLAGHLHGSELINAVKHAHVFVSTSIVEGYPLVLVEAQALGLPVVMYDLPWLEFLRDNSGVLTVPQGDRSALAATLAVLVADKDHYSDLSNGALKKARMEASYDLEQLYLALLQGALPGHYSPNPSPAVMRLILDQNVQFVERLERVHRREINRKESDFTRQIGRIESEAKKSRGTISAKSDPTRKAPMVPRVGAWLQRFLPATMRQAAYYARHDFSIASKQHDQLLANQAALSVQLARIEAGIDERRS